VEEIVVYIHLQQTLSDFAKSKQSGVENELDECLVLLSGWKTCFPIY